MTIENPKFETLKMNNIVSEISEKTGLEKGVVTRTILALKETILESIEEGKNVDLGVDFGRFENKETGSRVIQIPNGVGETKTEGRRKMVFKLSARKMNKMPIINEVKN